MNSNHLLVISSLLSQLYLESWEIAKFFLFPPNSSPVPVLLTRMHLAVPEFGLRKELDIGHNSLLN